MLTRMGLTKKLIWSCIATGSKFFADFKYIFCYRPTNFFFKGTIKSWGELQFSAILSFLGAYLDPTKFDDRSVDICVLVWVAARDRG